jgi:hypothetical protein
VPYLNLKTVNIADPDSSDWGPDPDLTFHFDAAPGPYRIVQNSKSQLYLKLLMLVLASCFRTV